MMILYHFSKAPNPLRVAMFLKEKNISKQIYSVNELTSNILDDFRIKKNDSLHSQELIEKIGVTILEKTTKKIDNFLNYENQ